MIRASLVVVLLFLLPFQGTPNDRRTGFAHGFGMMDAGAVDSIRTRVGMVTGNLAGTTAINTAVAATDLHPTTTTLAASGLFDNVPVAEGTDLSFGFETAPATLTASKIWALRIASGVLTYFGFVFATDRPKGQLGVPLIEDENNPNGDGCLRVGPSTVPGAGLGLFAARSMPRGTVLGTYPGVLLPLGQHSASSKVRDCPGCASYIWRFTDNQYVIDPTDHHDGTLSALCKGGNPSQPLSVVFFDVLFRLGLWGGVSTALCRINEPPKGRDVNVVTEEDLETRTVKFALERDIFEGEELYIDYGLTYDRSLYGNPGSGI